MTIDLLRRLTESAAPDVRVPGLFGNVVTPAGRWSPAKVWITNDLVLVYAEEAGQPALVASAEIMGFEQPGNANLYRIETVDGEVWEFTPTGNCGCGSSLKGFNPFPPPNRKGS